MAEHSQPKQYHNLPFYFGIVAATTLIVGLPAVAAVRTTTVTSMAVVQNTNTNAPVPQTVKDRLAEKVNEFQTQTFEQRQQAVLNLLDKLNKALTAAETALAKTDLSEETKQATQASIDAGQTQVTSLQDQVKAATTVEQLVTIRQAAMQVLVDNKDELKAVGVDIYVDSLNIMVEGDAAAVSSANTVTVYLTQVFVKNNVDITKLTETLVAANLAVKQAQDSLAKLDATNSEQMTAATLDVLVATQTTTTMNQELDKAVNQLPKQ